MLADKYDRDAKGGYSAGRQSYENIKSGGEGFGDADNNTPRGKAFEKGMSDQGKYDNSVHPDVIKSSLDTIRRVGMLNALDTAPNSSPDVNVPNSK